MTQELNLDNLYNIQDDLSIETKRTTYVAPGIHENIELKNVEYNKTENSEYLAFSFENKDEDKLSHTEYKSRQVNLENNTPEQNLHATKQKIENQLKRIGQIVTTFVSVDKYLEAIKGKQSFEAVCNAIIALLGDSYKGKKVRVKVVYDRNYKYTCLPDYNSYQFIESMLISNEESKIRELSIDRFKRPNNTPDRENNTKSIEDLIG